MTEGPCAQHGSPPMCVRIWLEVGHACDPPRRSALGRSLALDWRVWVRGAGGGDISCFVHKVVFHLHPASAFVYPKRVIQEPPYEIQESGCASIEIPIHVYLKNSNKPKKIRLKYSLQVENKARGSSETRCVFYDFKNPPEQLWRALMQGGGEVVARAQPATLVLLCDARRGPGAAPPPRRARRRRAHRACPRCDLHALLRGAALTRDEVGRVSQLYLAYECYDKSLDALKLPPLSDPIYRVPELPWSLKEELRATKLTSQSTSACHDSDYREF